MKNQLKSTSVRSLVSATLVAGSFFASTANASSIFNFEFMGTGSEVRNELLLKSKSLDGACGEKAKEDKTKEAKCGEAKCGEKKEAKKENKKNDKKAVGKKKESKTKEAKCGQGKCGTN